MFDLLTASPTCQTLTVSSYLAGFAGDAVRTALESSGYFPERYISALEDASFYCNLRNYILYDSILDKWMMFVVNNLAKLIMAMSTAFVSLWVVMVGFKMISGTNREPMTDLMFRGAKIVFVLALVSGMMGNTDTIVHTVLGLQSSIATIVTGSTENLDTLIDMNIGITQVINMVVEDVTNATAQQENQTGGLSIFAGLLGQSGPAILTSVLVLLAQIAIVFALMLAPLFIFFLLFKETTTLFWSWAKFLLGSFLSLSFLAIISTIAMSATLSYGLTVMVSFVLNAVADSGEVAGAVAEGIILLINGSQRVDMSGAAMRMAMMGGLFATLIVAVPPMIMQMFNASIGYASNLMGSMGIIRPMGGMNPGMAGMGGQASGQQGGGSALGNSNAMPGLARLGQGGNAALEHSGPAGGMANSGAQNAINAANRLARTNDGVDGAGGTLSAGSLGLAGSGAYSPNLANVQARQVGLGDDLRGGAAGYVGLTGGVTKNGSSGGYGVVDAVVKHPSSTATQLEKKLLVSGDQATPTAGATKGPALAPAALQSGIARDHGGGTSASAESPTPTYMAGAPMAQPSIHPARPQLPEGPGAQAALQARNTQARVPSK